jgi:hypothetical protein
MKHTIKADNGKTRQVDYSSSGRAKAIHYFCVECTGFNPMQVKGCTALTCPLFPYRIGTGKAPDWGATLGNYKVESGILYERHGEAWQAVK